MATIKEYRSIPLGDLVIGKAQVRVSELGAGIDELAESIRVQGLLQPIVVCRAEDGERWEILTGQRRFLAHQQLQRDSIYAAILDERVDEAEAKAISITENLVRRKLTGRDLKDGILFLYNRYGSVRDVADKTGISQNQVRANVKYPRLHSRLQQLVDDNAVPIQVAVKANDAAMDATGEVNPDEAEKLAREMAPMADVQRRKLIQDRREHPEKSVDDVIEHAKTGGQIIQVITTVSAQTHAAIQRVAKEEGLNQDEATSMLIEEALAGRGAFEEE